MPLLVLCYLAIAVVMVDCKPKIGHILFDPLNYEAVNLKNNLTESFATKTEGHNHSPITKLEIILRGVSGSANHSAKNNTELYKEIYEKMALNDVEQVNETVKNITSKNKSTNSSEIQSDLGNDTSEHSDWLDPELDSSENDSKAQIFNFTNTFGTASVYMESKTKDLNPDVTEPFKYTSQSELDTKTRSTSQSKLINPQKCLMKIIRNAAVLRENINPSDGYDYDVTICQYFMDRYLCGYNKNVGEITVSQEIRDLGNGCQIRGDRMECGYNVIRSNVRGNADHNPTGEQNKPTQTTISSTMELIRSTDVVQLAQVIDQSIETFSTIDKHVKASSTKSIVRMDKTQLTLTTETSAIFPMTTDKRSDQRIKSNDDTQSAKKNIRSNDTQTSQTVKANVNTYILDSLKRSEITKLVTTIIGNGTIANTRSKSNVVMSTKTSQTTEANNNTQSTKSMQLQLGQATQINNTISKETNKIGSNFNNLSTENTSDNINNPLPTFVTKASDIQSYNDTQSVSTTKARTDIILAKANKTSLRYNSQSPRSLRKSDEKLLKNKKVCIDKGDYIFCYDIMV